MATNNAFVQLDAGLASLLTNNSYFDEAQEQAFFHQFGIGTNASVGIGYSLQPFKSKPKTIDLQVIYQFNSTRVEVNGIGNDQCNYSAITVMAAINL